MLKKKSLRVKRFYQSSIQVDSLDRQTDKQIVEMKDRDKQDRWIDRYRPQLVIQLDGPFLVIIIQFYRLTIGSFFPLKIGCSVLRGPSGHVHYDYVFFLSIFGLNKRCMDNIPKKTFNHLFSFHIILTIIKQL